jgi:hypothetical protein
MLDGNEKELTRTRYTYNPDPKKFIEWLNEGRGRR